MLKLFAASQGKGFVMDTVRKQRTDHPTIMMHSTTNKPQWTVGALRRCPVRASLAVHDEGGLVLASMLLMARRWPIVGGLHSFMFKAVTAMAAAVHWPPPVAHTTEASPWVDFC